jgi:sulfur transfer complex TusBCD TusB component (DsrH family)
MTDLERARQECREAVLAQLAAVGASQENPVNLYLIGPALIARGYTQQQIVGALDMLAYEKRLEYIGENRVRMTR